MAPFVAQGGTLIAQAMIALADRDAALKRAELAEAGFDRRQSAGFTFEDRQRLAEVRENALIRDEGRTEAKRAEVAAFRQQSKVQERDITGRGALQGDKLASDKDLLGMQLESTEGIELERLDSVLTEGALDRAARSDDLKTEIGGRKALQREALDQGAENLDTQIGATLNLQTNQLESTEGEGDKDRRSALSRLSKQIDADEDLLELKLDAQEDRQSDEFGQRDKEFGLKAKQDAYLLAQTMVEPYVASGDMKPWEAAEVETRAEAQEWVAKMQPKLDRRAMTSEDIRLMGIAGSVMGATDPDSDSPQAKKFRELKGKAQKGVDALDMSQTAYYSAMLGREVTTAELNDRNAQTARERHSEVRSEKLTDERLKLEDQVEQQKNLALHNAENAAGLPHGTGTHNERQQAVNVMENRRRAMVENVAQFEREQVDTRRAIEAGRVATEELQSGPVEKNRGVEKIIEIDNGSGPDNLFIMVPTQIREGSWVQNESQVNGITAVDWHDFRMYYWREILRLADTGDPKMIMLKAHYLRRSQDTPGGLRAHTGLKLGRESKSAEEIQKETGRLEAQQPANVEIQKQNRAIVERDVGILMDAVKDLDEGAGSIMSFFLSLGGEPGKLAKAKPHLLGAAKDTIRNNTQIEKFQKRVDKGEEILEKTLKNPGIDPRPLARTKVRLRIDRKELRRLTLKKEKLVLEAIDAEREFSLRPSRIKARRDEDATF